MSESDNQATSILLPSSKLAVYSKDPTTLEAAQGLEDDWRFARVRIAGEEGGVESAIQVYHEISSPDLIVIQTDTIDEGFTEKLGELAGHCDEGTSAIIIGPDNDVNLYRKLIDMGVSDYMVRPVSTEDLAEVVAKALIEKIGVTGSRLIALTGAKGGVGTTIIAEALACGVSDILGQKAMLLDTSGGWSTLGVGLGFEPSTTLDEAVRAAENNDEDSIKRMLHNVDERLQVLATGGDVMLEDTVTPEQFEALIDMLMVKCPTVIVDVSHSPAALQRCVITRANQIMVVSTPTLPALRLARSLIQEVRQVRGGDHGEVSLIINMQGQAASSEVSKNDIEKAMELSVAAYLPFDSKVFLNNESESKKLTEDKAARDIIDKHLLPLVRKHLAAAESSEQPEEDGGFLDGILGKLKKKA